MRSEANWDELDALQKKIDRAEHAQGHTKLFKSCL
jgi:hypothetical protein